MPGGTGGRNKLLADETTRQKHPSDFCVIFNRVYDWCVHPAPRGAGTAGRNEGQAGASALGGDAAGFRGDANADGAAGSDECGCPATIVNSHNRTGSCRSDSNI